MVTFAGCCLGLGYSGRPDSIASVWVAGILFFTIWGALFLRDTVAEMTALGAEGDAL